ncbi:MAG: hypothetical protein PHH81_06545 [Bacteroides graminisolvens]|nr:hypothetical protein [Bacteroides graminisolvens]
MKKNFFTVALATISLSVFVSSCNNEQKEFPVDESQETQTYDLERLTFKSSQDLVSVIQSGNQSNTTDFIETRGLHFKSLLSTISDKATRSSSTTYYEALGYDTLVPNRSFAALLNPQGEVEVNDTIYRINQNGTYFFTKENETKFNAIYNTDSLGILVKENLYKLADGIYRYKTFQDNIAEEIIDLPDNENDDSWFAEENTTRAAIPEPNYDSFPQFNADRHTWLGKKWQKFFGNDKYYSVKLSSKRRVRGRLYAYHYLVYSESGVTGMMQKKNWIGWSKTRADELRIGWKNIILAAEIDDPSLKGIPKLSTPIIGNIYQTEIPSVGMGNLVDIYIAEVKTKDLLNIAKEVSKLLKPKNKKIDAVCVATRNRVYLVILDNIRKEFDTKSMTHVFSSRFNIMVSINTSNIPSGVSGLGKALSQTLKQKSFELEGGEAIICGRLNNSWEGMNIIKKID